MNKEGPLLERLMYHLSQRMANVADLEEEQREVIEYSLIWIGNTLLGFAGFIAFGYAFGALTATLAAGTSAAFLRAMSGGAHYSAPLRCATLTVLTMGVLGLVAHALAATTADHVVLRVCGGVLLLFGTPLVWRLAPVAHVNRPISDAERQKFQRLATLLFSLLSLIVISGFPYAAHQELRWGIFFGSAWQLLTLTALGERVVRVLDSVPIFVGRRTNQ